MNESRAEIFQRHARTVEVNLAAVEAARERITFLEANQAHLVETLVATSVELGECLQDLQRVVWQELFSGELVEVQQQGTTLRETYARVLSDDDEVEKIVSEVEARRFDISGAARFREVHEKVKALAADFEKRWPFFDRTELEQAQERIERGEGLSVEEFRRALLDQD